MSSCYANRNINPVFNSMFLTCKICHHAMQIVETFHLLSCFWSIIVCIEDLYLQITITFIFSTFTAFHKLSLKWHTSRDFCAQTMCLTYPCAKTSRGIRSKLLLCKLNGTVLLVHWLWKLASIACKNIMTDIGWGPSY